MIERCPLLGRFPLALCTFGQAFLLWGWGWTHYTTSHPVGYVGRSLSTVAGPFRTVVERFEKCPSTESWSRHELVELIDASEAVDAFVVDVSRLSREWGPRAQSQRIAGNLTLHATLDDSSSTLLTIDKWNNNQWKRNAFIMRLPGLCSALRGRGLLSSTGCPAQKGVYPFEDVAADWQFEAMPHFYYGTWRAEAVFNQDGVRRGCLRWLFKTSPAWPEAWPLDLDEPILM